MSKPTKFHVGKNGPGECRAFVRPCRLQHYDSMSEAGEAFQRQLKEEYGAVTKVSKEPQAAVPARPSFQARAEAAVREAVTTEGLSTLQALPLRGGYRLQNSHGEQHELMGHLDRLGLASYDAGRGVLTFDKQLKDPQELGRYLAEVNYSKAEEHLAEVRESFDRGDGRHKPQELPQAVTAADEARELLIATTPASGTGGTTAR